MSSKLPSPGQVRPRFCVCVCVFVVRPWHDCGSPCQATAKPDRKQTHPVPVFARVRVGVSVYTQAVYCAAKMALFGYFSTLATELSDT
jgi:hypothetical protein